MRDASLCDSAAANESTLAEAAGDNASAGAMAPLPGCAPANSQMRVFRNAPANFQTSTADRTPASSQLHIRLASANDADGIRAVYAPFVDTPVTFEEEAPSREAYRERIVRICEKYPCLVAEEGGRVVGFAYAHELRERIAFQWNAELSVYLAPTAQGQGAGSRLYAALIELLRLTGIKVVYGVVTSPNAASERLHSAFGFALMGVQPHAGFTCGAWHDVSWYVREIAPFEDAPAPPVPFPLFASAHPDQVSEVIAQANERLRL